jgi:hypothetical protein
MKTRHRCLAHCRLLSLLALFSWSVSAAPVVSVEPGRLFYTPAQRAQLEDARARHVTPSATRHPSHAPVATPPQAFDGEMIRSDGQATRWVNGKAQRGATGVTGLKPGQIRADGKIYEPYQLLRPAPPAGAVTHPESAP